LFVTAAAVVLGPGAWVLWAFQLARARRLRAGPGAGALAAALLACTGIIFIVLITAASTDVREAPQYLLMYVVLGLAWLRMSEPLFAMGGVSARDDVIERRNHAALLAVSGALAGVTLCYAGGNIGDGPGWWVVVFSAALATLGLALAWALHERLTGSSDVIAIDRDPSAGLRFGAFLVACGLVLGRGVAGDWVSARQTVEDFLQVIPPLAVILALAWIIERMARPTAERPRAPMAIYGVGVALVYIGLAVAFVMAIRRPM
jgi:uncharacterized membrane protein YjfL (UPF0719 family)